MNDLKSSPTQQPAEPLHLPLPSVPEAAASLLRTVTVALFLLTFVLQPYLIPSESMEHTLLVGDFLLVNKQIYAPSDFLTRHLLPYREVKRGDIVVFRHGDGSYLVKRVVGIPGDRLKMSDARVTVNGQALDEPYVAMEPAAFSPFRDDFPASDYTDPEVDRVWWHQMQSQVHNGELIVPAGQYFVLGDNRNHSKDSRFWGFVDRREIIARPLVVYFSVARPSTTDVAQVIDDRLNHDRELSNRLTGFARWNRIFHVVH